MALSQQEVALFDNLFGVKSGDAAGPEKSAPASDVPVNGDQRMTVENFTSAIRKTEGSGSGAVSHKGARGSMQIMPETFKQYALKDSNGNLLEDFNNDDDRVRAAQRKIADDWKWAGGDPVKASMAYFMGRGGTSSYLNGGKNGGDGISSPEQYVMRTLRKMGFDDAEAEGLMSSLMSRGKKQEDYKEEFRRTQPVTDIGMGLLRESKRQEDIDKKPIGDQLGDALGLGWERFKTGAMTPFASEEDLAQANAGDARLAAEIGTPSYVKPYHEQVGKINRAESTPQAIGQIAKLFSMAFTNPKGFLYLNAENAANQVSSLGGMAGGALAGGAVGGPVGALVGLGVGSVIGNSPEYGAKLGELLNEEAQSRGLDPRDPDALMSIMQSPGFMQKANDQGLTKWLTIAGVDAASGGLSGRIFAAPKAAWNSAVRSTLTKNGVDLADSAAVTAALKSPNVLAALKPAAEQFAKSSSFARTVARGVGATGVEMLGEGAGEYVGEGNASGEWNLGDAALEGLMSAGQSIATPVITGEALSGFKRETDNPLVRAAMNVKPERKPNSPLTNAANVAVAAQQQSQQAAPDEFAGRLSQAQYRLEDPALLRNIRNAPGLGEQSVRELLSSWAIARNPSIDASLRNRAMGQIEGFFQTFDSRPDFTMGGQSAQSDQSSADLMPVPAARRDVGPAMSPSENGNVYEGEFSEIEDPRPQLETEQAVQAKRNADAEYEQAYQDLVKAEQLGASDVELMQMQEAVRTADVQRQDADARLGEIQQTIETNRAEGTRRNRNAVLDQILADPETQNPANRFASELARRGFRDTAPTPEEMARISRAQELAGTFNPEPEIEPSAPNELDPYAPRKSPAITPEGRQTVNERIGNGFIQIDDKDLFNPATKERFTLTTPALRQYARNALNRHLKQTAIDQSAHESSTSPTNRIDEPSEAQKQAGNYKMGHIKIAGLDITVENPAGSVRSGVDEDGNAWTTVMHSHYGYIRGSDGADGDHVDVFVKPGTPEDYSGPAFVIDQVNPENVKFDEHKTMLGYASMKEAREGYLANYTPDWNGLGAITGMSMAEFKYWVRNEDTTAPVGDIGGIQEDAFTAADGDPLMGLSEGEWADLTGVETGNEQQDEDLGAMFDEVLAEETGVTIENAEEGLADTQRTAGEAAASAAQNTAAGLNDAIAGLGKLFGGNGRLSSGLTFDEETYAKAKPLFKQAISHFQAAGTDLKEAMRAIVRMVLDQFGPEAAAGMKPYVVRFIEDIRAGATTLETAGKNQEINDERPRAGGKGQEALEGASAEDVPGTEGERGTGTARRPGGGTVAQGDSGIAAAGLQGVGSRGNRAAEVHPAAGRRGSEGRVREDGAGGQGASRPADAGSARPAQTPRLPGERLTAPGNVPAANFRITPELRLGKGGLTEKFDDNLRAIRLLKEFESQARRATPDEQNILARYVGWGGLQAAFERPLTNQDGTAQVDGEGRPVNGWPKGWEERGRALKALLTLDEYDAARRSTLDAHYTSEPIIQAMWSAARHFGFRGGVVLEPSMGVGNFLGLAPEDIQARFVGVELDSLTGRIARQLYPQAAVIVRGFQDVPLPDNSVDMAIGNPPFGSQTLYDKDRSHLGGYSIHNYFFAKSIETVRPGGVQIMVVSNFFMDKQGEAQRGYISSQAKLLGAIRLPNSAFMENANTEVTTDIVFLQKRMPGERFDAETEESWAGLAEINDPLGGDPIPVNEYFARHPEMLLGRMERSGTMRHKGQPTLAAIDGQDIGLALDAAIRHLPENVFAVQDAAANAEQAFETMRTALELQQSDKEDGAVYFGEDGRLNLVRNIQLPDSGSLAFSVPITPDTPWGGGITPTPDGKWFRHVAKTDADGNTAKNDKGRVVYERIEYANAGEVPATLRLGQKKFSRLRGLMQLRDAMRKQINLEMDHGAEDSEVEANRKELKGLYDAFVKESGFISESANQQVMAGEPDAPLVSALELSYDPGITLAKSRKTGAAPRKPSATPAPILTQRAIPLYVSPDSAETPKDALVISLSESGRVNLLRMTALLNGTEADVVKALHDDLDEPLIFRDPEEGEWQTRDQYLSGQVKRKLEAAKQHGLMRNVEALEKVQPEDIPIAEVGVRIGSVWVPVPVYMDFIKHLLGTDGISVRFRKYDAKFLVSGKDASAKSTQVWGTQRMPAVDIIDSLLNSQAVRVYDIHPNPDGTETRTLNEEETALAGAKSSEINNEFQDWIYADAARREQLGRIYNDTYNTLLNRQYDGSHLTLPGKVPDAIIKMRRHQNNAIWRSIQEKYTLLDHTVGSGKTFTIVASAMELRRMGLAKKPMVTVPNHLVEQWATDFYRLYPGARILAATKKDFEKARRQRLFSRIATGEWDAVIVAHSSFKKIGIHPETEARMIKDDIKEIELAIREEEIATGTDPKSRRKPRSVKDIERTKERLEERLKRLHDMERDTVLTFEQLSVDQLFVDEAHTHKNLFYFSRLQNVLGLGNKDGSKQALDLYNKIRVMRERKHLRGGVVFATGTPISNSIVEMYTMMRYLAPDLIKDMGIENFDAWHKQFAEAVTAMEMNEAGGLVEKTRMSRFSNMPELMAIYYSFADSVSLDDIKRWYAEDNAGKRFPVPKVKGEKRRNIVVEPTQAQQHILAGVVERFNGLKDIDDWKERNKERLRLMSDARKVALDARVVNPHAPDEEGSKLDQVSKEVKRIYDRWQSDRGTQLVFLDLSVPRQGADKELKTLEKSGALRLLELEAQALSGNEDVRERALETIERMDDEAVEELRKQIELAGGREGIEALRSAMRGGFTAYDDMKAKLMSLGIPEREIRFVQEANTDKQKQDLFDAVNAGDVRVLIGSTPRMGAGTNVQERLVGLHHVDVTWKPSDIEQREGRIERQGNSLLEKYGEDFEVEILAYATERTYDAKMWSITEGKMRFINALRHYEGAREVEMDDTESANMAEMAALASGDPMLLERVKIEQELKKLDLLRRSHRRRTASLEDNIRSMERDLERLPSMVEHAKADYATLNENRSAMLARVEQRRVTVDGKEYSSHASAYAAAMDGINLQQGGDDKAKYVVDVNGKKLTNKAAIDEEILSVIGDNIPFEATIGDETMIRRSRAAKRLYELFSEIGGGEYQEREVGSYMGFKVSLFADQSNAGMVLEGESKHHKSWFAGMVRSKESQDYWEGPSQRSLANALESIEMDLYSSLNSYRRRLESAQRDLPELKAQYGKPFAQEDEYQSKTARFNDLTKQLAAQANGKQTQPGTEQTEPALSRRKTPAHGMPIEDVRALVDVLTAKWRSAGRIQVVKNPSALEVLGQDSADLLDRIRKVNAEGTAQGVYENGLIYLFADNLANTEEVERVLLHEATHMGLDSMFGRGLDAVMMQIYTQNSDVQEKANALMAKYEDLTRVKAVYEVLADMGGDGIEVSVWEKIVAFVRGWLRRMDFSLKIGDGEIRALVTKALAYTKGGHTPGGPSKSSFALSLGTQTEGLPLFTRSSGANINGTSPTVNEANREKTNSLERAISRGGDLITITPVTSPSEMLDDAAWDGGGQDADARRTQAAHFRAAENIAGLFGKKVIPILADGDFAINGVVNRGADPDSIFIDIRTDVPAHIVMGHELSHHIETDAPKLYAELMDAISGMLQGHAEYRTRYSIPAQASDNAVSKEMVGDLLGDSFTHPEFWDMVGAQNPSLLRRLADNVTKWLNRLITKSVGKGYASEQWVTDARGARKILAKAVAKYAVGKKASPGTAGAMFERVYSRNSQTLAAKVWRILAGDEAIYQQAMPDSFDMGEAAKEIDPGMSAVADKPDLDEQKTGIVKKWYVKMPDGTHAYVMENKQGEVWLNASDLAEGVSGGTKLYLLVGSYAEGNGKVFIGDPAGLSDVALIRRTENMLSLALRFGKTDFMRPHEYQMNPDAKLNTMLADVVRPMEWVEGDNANNLEELLRTSYANTVKLVPEIKNVTYNFDQQRFEHNDGRVLDNEYFDGVARGIGDSLRKRGLSSILGHAVRDTGGNQRAPAERPPVGSATLKRAAILNTVARAARGGRGGELLAEIGRVVPGGLKGTPLAGILYSRTNQTETEAFKKWFGDSKVVDKNGLPLVVYHGTNAPVDFTEFTEGGWFSASKEYASLYGNDAEQGRVIPAYLRIERPITPAQAMDKAREAGIDWDNDDAAYQKWVRENYDGYLIRKKGMADAWVPFYPNQVKSAIGNNGSFDHATADIMFSRTADIFGPGFNKADESTELSGLHSFANMVPEGWVKPLTDRVAKMFKNTTRFGWLDKSIHSQLHKASKNRHFAETFKRVQAFMNDASRAALRPAELAPTILPRIDVAQNLRPAFEALLKGKVASADIDAAFQSVLRGTLDNTVYQTADEAGLDDAQFGLYREFRDAIDASLDEVASAEAWKIARNVLGKSGDLRKSVIDNPTEAESLLIDQIEQEIDGLGLRIQAARDAGTEPAEKDVARLSALTDAHGKLSRVFERRDQLQKDGYAPLMRFGQYSLYVYRMDPTTGEPLVDENGEQVSEFFGLFESEAERDMAEKEMREQFADQEFVEFESGTVSEESWKMYRGVSPETVALFAEAVGIDGDEVFQEWYRKASANRSALKRLIHRKGVPGFSTDGSRVLASFLTSNGRRAAQQYHTSEIMDSVEAFPKTQGAEKDEAVKMWDYIQNPQEEVGGLRAFMFFHFLGGTLSNFFINATQPAMMTLPYLAQQVGMPKAMSLLKAAYKHANADHGLPGDVAAALAEAEQEGVVSAQEIHHLWQETARPLVNKMGRFGEDVTYRAHAFMHLWGLPFALAEHINRRVTFIAAYEAAKERGLTGDAAYAEAVRAINETQIIYNKSNRPNWARGNVGSLVFTFKLFSISYVELLVRMLRSGKDGQKAALYMLGMLMLASGLQGLPGGDDLDDLIDTAAQLMGYNMSTTSSKRKWLENLAGEQVAEFMMYGLSAMTPLDVSSRMGMGNLIPGSGVFKPSNDRKFYDVLEIVGPVGGLMRSYVDTIDAVGTGNWSEATTAWMPKAVKDLAKAGEMAVSGEYRDPAGRKVDDITPFDAMVKAIGFQPQSVAMTSRAGWDVQQRVNFARRRESIIVGKWARSIVERDPDGAQEAMREIQSWNAMNPDTPIAVKRSQVQRRVKEMHATKDERLLKAMPRELRETMKEELQ